MTTWQMYAPPVASMRECFEPDFEAGLLVWKERPEHHFLGPRYATRFNRHHAGKPAGGRIERRSGRERRHDLEACLIAEASNRAAIAKAQGAP